MSIPANIKARIPPGFQTAASNGDVNAAKYLYLCYGLGFGVEVDREKMLSWAIKAAELGDLDPVKDTAALYKYYMDDLADYGALLFPWLLKAAESGHKDSMWQISDCYKLGIGTEKNFQKHDEWDLKYWDTHETEPSDSSPTESSLFRASRTSNLNAVKFILRQENADVDARDAEGSTSLSLAAKGGNIDIVKLLVVEFNADVNARDKDGWTPLHLAASNGHLKVVKHLVVEFKAGVNARNNSDWTPLHLAASNGHLKVVKLLVVK